jgi:hypothetical protein
LTDGKDESDVTGGADMTMQDILDDIDATTEPSRMSKTLALEWLEKLVSEIETRMDALKEEIREERL